MNDRKPTAQSSARGVPGSRTNGPTIAPIEPDADDGWKIPLGPIEEIPGKDEAAPEPVEAVHSGGMIQRLTHRG
jgi:hypothetical protein